LVSLDPLAVSDLTLESVVRPGRIAPLAIHVYSVARPLPRFALAAHVEAAPDREAAVARAAGPGFQPAGGVVIEGNGPSAGSRGVVTSSGETPDELTFEVESDGPGLLIVRDSFARGWAATVNAAEAPVLRADGRHRAVPVPAGRSRVRMAYRPPGLTLAWGLSLASLLAALAIHWRHRAAPRASRQLDPFEATR
jgi:hypothetical protein